MTKREIVAVLLAGFLVLSGAGGYRWLHKQIRIDGCLDLGGRWNHKYSACDGDPHLTVFYADFESEPFVPYHAEDLPRVGCRYLISRELFDGMKKRVAGDGAFDPLNVKAVVEGKTYPKTVIAWNGMFLQHGKAFQVYRQDFVDALTPNGGCPPNLLP